MIPILDIFFFSSRRRHTRWPRDWSSDVCSSDLRHIIIRTGYETDEVMVTFVTNTKDLPHSNKIIKRLTEKFPEIVSIVHNVNLEKKNVIIGKKIHLLYGENYLYDKKDDFIIRNYSVTFYLVIINIF